MEILSVQELTKTYDKFHAQQGVLLRRKGLHHGLYRP